MKMLLVIALLGALTFVTALQLVATRYENRLLVVSLQELKVQRDDLEREWGQLLLEQGTWNTHSRIEELARAKLNMMVPDVAKLRRIKS